MAEALATYAYRPRPATMDDAAEVASVIAACEIAYDHGTVTSETDVRDEWRNANFDEDTVVFEDPSGAIVAAADMLNRQYTVLTVYGSVHPEHEGQGLGSEIVAWGERWAREHMHLAPPDRQIAIRYFIQSKNNRAIELMTEHGYEPIRHTYVMAIDLDHQPPAPEWPEGIVASEYRPGIDERDVHEAVEDAFRDLWGRPPSDFERFLAFSSGDGVKPDLWILARADGEVVGVCLGTLTNDQGWIPTVGVRRAWRRKGLALALLYACFGAYYQRGIRDVRLSVDAQSPTGATRLYERAGMHVASNYILYQKILRDGLDTETDTNG
ncbi:MAG: GNAT family N-acetyltransferase [Thermomicrobiales bacterium]